MAIRAPLLAGSLAALLFGSAVAAEPGPRFDLPVDCEMGRVCFVQNYVDREPGPVARDHACGLLTYDGHKGTDIRVPDLLTMRKGIAVVAAAPGAVRGVRDGMSDDGVSGRGDPAVEGRECGNGVLIDHGGGWVSQYCHLRRDSVAVRRGQRVDKGQRLGLIGQSGQATFPHVHFEVRRDKAVIDPFAGAPAATACGSTAAPMWSEAAAEGLAYVETGVLAAGLTDTAPKLKGVLAGRYRTAALAADAPALILWALVYGIHAGDVEVFRIVGPAGRVVLESRLSKVDRHKAQWMSYSGKRRKGGA